MVDLCQAWARMLSHTVKTVSGKASESPRELSKNDFLVWLSPKRTINLDEEGTSMTIP